MDAVTTILRDRGRERGGLRSMVTLSLVAHGAVAALLVVVPAQWEPRSDPDRLRTVMTISLGGAPGPRAGGMTPMGGRPIQDTAPLPDIKRPEPIRPPAPRTPEMTMPAPGARPSPRTPVRTAPDEAQQAKTRTPAREQEEQPGSSVAETGGRGLGFGLSTGGGGTGGYLDVGDFCCPEYLTTMLQRIQSNWNARQEVGGESMVKFTIQRDGRISDVQLEQSSGYAALDLTAQRALLLTRQLPPLPTAFPNDTLTVHLRFQYRR